MRFFHLADLHLGKCIHGYSLIEMGDQPFWISKLLEKVDELKPEAVLISGDVYDRAVPSKEAVKLFDGLLTELAKRKLPVLMIAGNHDSGSRLAFGDKLLCHQGIYIAGEVTREISCVTLEDRYGPVHFWLVPYLFPAAVNVVLDREDVKDYDTAMRELLAEQSIDFSQRNVILAHQFVMAGGQKPSMGGSETTVGGIGQVDAELFKKFNYTALGHIHNAQTMGSERVRYAGSPLCYHFSETGQRKGLTVVDMDEQGNITVLIEEIPVLHRLCEMSGTVEELLQMEPEKGSYLRIVLTQEVLPPQVLERLRSHFESKDCILMEVVRDFSYHKRNLFENEKKDVRKLSLEELFAQFYQEQLDGELPEEALEKLIAFTAEQIRNGLDDETEKERQENIRKLIEAAEERA